MNVGDSVRMAFNSLTHRQLRAWLTLVGIIIGVAAVVAIISIGEGAQASVGERLSGFGADIVTVTPGASSAMRFMGEMRGPSRDSASSSSQKPLTDMDAIVLRSMPEIAYVNEIVSGRASMTYLAEEASVSVKGVNPVSWKFITTSELASGRFLSSGDVGGVVIGYRIANEDFKKPLTVGSTVYIAKKPFKVLGILKEAVSGGDNSTVFVVTRIAQEILEDVSKNNYSSIELKLASDASVEEDTAAIQERLMLSRHVTESSKDFTVTSGQAIMAQVESVTQSLTLFLVAIAAVSLLVGSVGIANSMFTSVLEKTREIGILKALGASNEEVLRIFLIESALFGLVGGVLGISLGGGISMLIPMLGVRLMGNVGLTTVLRPELLVFTVVFSTVIGVVSGLFPARQAAKMSPVDALRYE